MNKRNTLKTQKDENDINDKEEGLQTIKAADTGRIPGAPRP